MVLDHIDQNRALQRYVATFVSWAAVLDPFRSATTIGRDIAQVVRKRVLSPRGLIVLLAVV